MRDRERVSTMLLYRCSCLQEDLWWLLEHHYRWESDWRIFQNCSTKPGWQMRAQVKFSEANTMSWDNLEYFVD